MDCLCVQLQKKQGAVTKVGQEHTTMGGHYTKGRRWRVEEGHRFFTNQLYPNDIDDAPGYKEQFRQVTNQPCSCARSSGLSPPLPLAAFHPLSPLLVAQLLSTNSTPEGQHPARSQHGLCTNTGMQCISGSS